jgi:hypothetical protein
MNFINKLSVQVDMEEILSDMYEVLDLYNWNENNQIGLRHRLNCENKWTDSIGGLYDKSTSIRLANEKDFSEWNDSIPLYTKTMLETLATSEGISWGRIRYMRLMPKTGLSIHRDDKARYHLALITDKNSIFAECFNNTDIRCTGYNIPVNGHFYKVDTTRYHFVYNGSWEPRIHLVCCPVKI